MKKTFSIILGLTCTFLACSCFPDKSSKSSDTSEPTSAPTTSNLTDYSSNPYIGSGSTYSLTVGSSTMSYFFDPNGSGVWTTTQISDGKEVKDSREFTYKLQSETNVSFKLKESGEEGVGQFTTTQNGQAFICLSKYFYKV